MAHPSLPLLLKQGEGVQAICNGAGSGKFIFLPQPLLHT